MEVHSRFDSALAVLSERLRVTVGKIKQDEAAKIQEIRLRQGKSLSLTFPNGELFVTGEGKLTQHSHLGIITEKADLETVFQTACRYSVHSFQRELSQGFLTITGGNRLGVCGSAVVKDGRVETIKDISSINIRIAKEIIGCSQELFNRVFSMGKKSVLIVGPPSSGKTTILRDLCRILGQANRLSIIDERNEISATVNAIARNDIGTHSDVFCGYPKAEGIITAIRVMSPEIVVCDEIGGNDDVSALESAIHSGVKIIATAHAGTIDEARKRSGISKLIKAGAFEEIVLLGFGERLGKIIAIEKAGDGND